VIRIILENGHPINNALQGLQSENCGNQSGGAGEHFRSWLCRSCCSTRAERSDHGSLFAPAVPPHAAETMDRHALALRTSQPLVTFSLGVQLVLQVVDVVHPLGVSRTRIRGGLACAMRPSFTPCLLQANGHVGQDLGLAAQFVLACGALQGIG
jgi:hypothetical protein